MNVRAPRSSPRASTALLRNSKMSSPALYFSTYRSCATAEQIDYRKHDGDCHKPKQNACNPVRTFEFPIWPHSNFHLTKSCNTTKAVGCLNPAYRSGGISVVALLQLQAAVQSGTSLSTLPARMRLVQAAFLSTSRRSLRRSCAPLISLY